MSSNETTQHTGASPSGQVQGPIHEVEPAEFQEVVGDKELDALGKDTDALTKSFKTLIDTQLPQFNAAAEGIDVPENNQLIQNIRINFDNMAYLVAHLPDMTERRNPIRSFLTSCTNRSVDLSIGISIAGVKYNFGTTCAQLQDIRLAIAYTRSAIGDVTRSKTDIAPEIVEALTTMDQALMNWRQQKLDPLMERANEINERLKASIPAL